MAITLPTNMATTEPADFHQPQVQNIYRCFFATGRFEDLTFCKPDVLQTWRFVNLTFQTFWNRTFWNLTFCGCTVLFRFTRCSLHLRKPRYPPITAHNCAVLFRFDEVFPSFKETAVPTYYSLWLCCSSQAWRGVPFIWGNCGAHPLQPITVLFCLGLTRCSLCLRKLRCPPVTVLFLLTCTCRGVPHRAV